MSQAPMISQGQDPIWTPISIAKFSHNTCPYGTRTFTWTHIGERSDLDLVFRSARVIDGLGNYAERLVMQVSAGAEQLEYQDLGELVKFAKEYDSSSGAEHPVQIVIKSPFLAMRYPKTTNTVRRIQVKFRNEADFSRALGFLRDLGLPILDNVQPAPKFRPTPSPAPSAASSSTLSAGSFQMSYTPAPVAQLFTPSFGRSLDTPALSPAKSEFKIPTRPESSNSEVQRSFSALAFQTSAATPPLSATSSSLALDLSHCRSQAEKGTRQLPHSVLHTSGPDAANSYFRSSSILNSSAKSQLGSISEDAEHNHRTLSESPFFSHRCHPAISERALFSVANSDDVFNQASDPKVNPIKPFSTPNDLSQIHSFTVPPPRELPFPKPQEKVRSASTSGLPPLSKPSLAETSLTTTAGNEDVAEQQSTPTRKPAKKRVAQRKPSAVKKVQAIAPKEIPQVAAPATSIITNEATNLQAPPAQVDEPSPLAAKSAAGSRPSSATSGLQSKATTARKRVTTPARPSSASKRSKMVDQSTQTQTLSGRDHTVLQRSISANSVPELDNSPTPESPPENYLNSLDSFVAKYKARPKPEEIWQAPEYAGTDEDRRRVLLNDFICDNLENADFLQLCQDTEKAWRRIGLGM
ncbi:hypothetical protein B0J14DRAFT_696905 [Halenospora varia]|nr:hypothetical protein B0J14DRAFT_696905 [Halenospora varia]